MLHPVIGFAGPPLGFGLLSIARCLKDCGKTSRCQERLLVRLPPSVTLIDLFSSLDCDVVQRKSSPIGGKARGRWGYPFSDNLTSTERPNAVSRRFGANTRRRFSDWGITNSCGPYA